MSVISFQKINTPIDGRNTHIRMAQNTQKYLLHLFPFYEFNSAQTDDRCWGGRFKMLLHFLLGNGF